MQVSDLKSALGNFNQSAAIMVAIPSAGKHEIRAIRHAGHLAHEGEIMTDHTIHALDIVCDPWDAGAQGAGPLETVGELATALDPYPDPMHVRVAVPWSQDGVSHRMLDIVMLGFAVGVGSGVQLVSESWDNPMQVIKAID